MTEIKKMQIKNVQLEPIHTEQSVVIKWLLFVYMMLIVYFNHVYLSVFITQNKLMLLII